MRNTALIDFWEARYQAADHIWSGKVNHVLAHVAKDLSPGTALDLGCGEGGDAIWLAHHGWRVTGLDIAPTAIARARTAADDAGVRDMARFDTADAAVWDTPHRFDFVTVSFLHSWSAPIPRDRILRRATGFVAPGGRFLLTSHAAPPPWADPQHAYQRPFPSIKDELASLRLSSQWTIERAELSEHETIGPDGHSATLVDSVIVARRAATTVGNAELPALSSPARSLAPPAVTPR